MSLYKDIKAKIPSHDRSPEPDKRINWRHRHPILWWVLLSVGGMISLLCVFLVVLYVFLNTPKGQRFVAQQIGKLTHQHVVVKDIRGSFPNHLTVASITLNDAHTGRWLTLENIKLDWSFASLFKKKIYIDSFYIQRFKLDRLPPPRNQTSQPVALPKFKIFAQINALVIDNLDIGSPVSSIDLHLSLNAKANIKDVLRVTRFASIEDLSNSELSLHLWERNGASRMDVNAAILKDQVTKACLKFTSYPQKHGILERMMSSNQVLPLELVFSAHGPFDKLSLESRLSAHTVSLQLDGLMDLLHYNGTIVAKGNSSALHVLPQISWASWNLDTKLFGNFKAPEGNGRFELNGLQVGSSGLERFVMSFKGKAEPLSQKKITANIAKEISLNIQAKGLRIPGDHDGVLKTNPIQVHAVYRLKPGNPSWELSFENKLISLKGTLIPQPHIEGNFFLNLPQLQPLGTLIDTKVEGSLCQTIHISSSGQIDQPIDVGMSGPIHIKGGEPILAHLIGNAGTLALNARMLLGDRKQFMLNQLDVKGRHLSVSGKGQFLHNQIDSVIGISIDQLSAIQPFLKGSLSGQLQAMGSINDPQAHIRLDTQFQGGDGTVYRLKPSQINLSIDATHLVTEPKADLSLTGNLDNSPIYLHIESGLDNQAKLLFLKLQHMKWKSLAADADIVLSQKTYMPMGRLKLEVASLSDFNQLFRQKLVGFVKLNLSSPSESHSRVLIDAAGALKASSVSLSGISLKGAIENPLEKPSMVMRLQANSIQAAKVNGSIKADANGSFDQLELKLQGDFTKLYSSNSTINLALMVNMLEKKLMLQRFAASSAQQNIRLLFPTLFSFGQKVALDRLRLSLASSNKAPPALIDIKGQIKPDLNLNVALKNLTPDLVKPFVPSLKARGIINAQAELHGKLDAPTGTIKVNGRQLAWASQETNFIPPAELNVSATLLSNRAQLNGQFVAGQNINASVQGKIPLNSTEQFSLQTKGLLDVSLANALLGAYAQQVKGIITLAMQVSGTLQRPILMGNLTLAHGSYRDFAQGISVNAITGLIVAQGDRIAIQSIDARAGEGTLHAAGQIGIFQNNIPVDVLFTMRNARPISSDLLTTLLDSDISVKGSAKTRLNVKGDIKIKRADINIPQSISRSVVLIKVVRPGDKEPVVVQTNRIGPEIGLNLTLQSAGPIIVRGFGLFSNMAGSLNINGTAQAPQINGGFVMRNGRIDLGGISLSFTRGVIGFNGSSVDHKIDPTLDFEVQRSVDGYTPKLKIAGYASAPKIELTSSPPISQDRILAMLLFGVDSQSLSATQMAEIGVALASIGGQGAGFDPIGAVRKTLGLDRLSIGSAGKTKEDGSSSGTSVSAGKYITKGVYVGAKQSTGNAGTQGEAQIDITKHLKATATVGTGHDNSRFVTPDNDPGSSVGLLYQFSY